MNHGPYREPMMSDAPRNHANMPNGSATRLALAIGVATLMLISAGCTQLAWGIADPSGYGYVHKKGGPEQIGNWALRQRDLQRIEHAQLALMRYMRNENSPAERRAAIEAYRRIDEQLALGWKGNYSPNDPEILRSRQGIRNLLRASCRDGVEEACQAESLFETLDDEKEDQSPRQFWKNSADE